MNFGECFVGEGMSLISLATTPQPLQNIFTGIEATEVGTYLISQQLGAASRNVLAAEIHTPAGSVFFTTQNASFNRADYLHSSDIITLHIYLNAMVDHGCFLKPGCRCFPECRAYTKSKCQ